MHTLTFGNTEDDKRASKAKKDEEKQAAKAEKQAKKGEKQTSKEMKGSLVSPMAADAGAEPNAATPYTEEQHTARAEDDVADDEHEEQSPQIGE